MKDKIAKICKSIEKEKKVKILFAVENGSRAWRMDSKDSDYDVRLVFVRPLNDYIQINKPSEVIEAYYDKQGNPCSSQGAFIDISGFDVFKYVKMLSSSNPTTIEWLMSDIVYYGEQNTVFKKFAINNFNKTSLYHHYKSMCRNNYLKYLKSGELVTYKKYLYAYRGLINAKWVVHKKSVPPIIFHDALKELKKFIPLNVFNKLNEIIELKSQGKEKDIIQNIVVMDNYIESFLKDDSEAPKEKSYATLSELNEELRKIVLLK
ncbi:nucleotidyltransferase domain-containing protein [Candidatus Woesearchaeota archaeon]|nr:nucleotidyltransferase domain-containing protein [Candidatus Woesearchaeota archaeon]